MFREFEAVVTGTAADGFLSQSTAIIRKPGRMTRFSFCTHQMAQLPGAEGRLSEGCFSWTKRLQHPIIGIQTNGSFTGFHNVKAGCERKGMLQLMNIIVCVKQTPEAGRGEMNPAAGTVDRTSQKQLINPFDLYAMEAALRVQEKAPDTRIIALSMGPASAASVLRDCIGLGAENGYLVCDPAFAGTDVRGTAQILARAVRVIEKREGIRADAVFCGAKTVDGGTSMLGPELAQFLGVPQVTYALHCSLMQTPEGQEETGQQEVTGRTGLQEVSGETSLKEVPAGTGIQGTALCVEKEDDRGNRIYCLPLPCLVTFTKASFQVRYPLIARILEAESMELPVLSAGDILAENLTGHGISEENSVKAGPDKAAMQVQEVELRKMDKQSQIIEDPDPVKAVTVLAQRLFSEGIL